MAKLEDDVASKNTFLWIISRCKGLDMTQTVQLFREIKPEQLVEYLKSQEWEKRSTVQHFANCLFEMLDVGFEDISPPDEGWKRLRLVLETALMAWYDKYGDRTRKPQGRGSHVSGSADNPAAGSVDQEPVHSGGINPGDSAGLRDIREAGGNLSAVGSNDQEADRQAP